MVVSHDVTVASHDVALETQLPKLMEQSVANPFFHFLAVHLQMWCICSCQSTAVQLKERKKEPHPWARVREGNGPQENLPSHPTARRGDSNSWSSLSLGPVGTLPWQAPELGSSPNLQSPHQPGPCDSRAAATSSSRMDRHVEKHFPPPC